MYPKNKKKGRAFKAVYLCVICTAMKKCHRTPKTHTTDFKKSKAENTPPYCDHPRLSLVSPSLQP
jgi:hypothetical protein